MMVGTASAWYPSMTIGIDAGIMALANCCPRECVQQQKLFREKKYEQAFELYQRMFPVNACVTGKLGVPALKYACDRLGYRGGSVRAPLAPLTSEQKKTVDGILEQAGLI